MGNYLIRWLTAKNELWLRPSGHNRSSGSGFGAVGWGGPAQSAPAPSFLGPASPKTCARPAVPQQTGILGLSVVPRHFELLHCPVAVHFARSHVTSFALAISLNRFIAILWVARTGSCPCLLQRILRNRFYLFVRIVIDSCDLRTLQLFPWAERCQAIVDGFLTAYLATRTLYAL